MKVSLLATLLVLVSAVPQVRAEDEVQDEACEVPNAQAPASSSALLQVQANKDAPLPHNALLQSGESRQCSYQLQGDQDGSKPCASLKGKKYISGRLATLDEAGYQQTALLCCHHEMSLFVRREIARQGFDVCDLSDLHGFVHWYDCSDDKKTGDDKKTYAEMKNEIAGVMTSACPWLGHLPNCPYKDPTHCGRIARCPATFPADSQAGSDAPLTSAGYTAVALRCCQKDMDAFVRREIARQGFKVCDEGSFYGFLHWFDCTNDKQTYAQLKEGIVIARSGLPPMCPWLGSVGQACPPKGHNCPVVEVPEPAAHRRRVACR